MKYLALCIMSKDENEYLKENIDYHTLLGVDHFFIYDNGSRKPLSSFLKNYSNVTVINWTDTAKGSHSRSFGNCLKLFGDRFRWIGFIDTDEFIVLKKGMTNIKQFLKGYEKYGGLGIQWKCFGGSGHNTKQQSVIESYIHASYTTDDKHIKSIVQPRFTSGPGGTPHAFAYKKGKFCVNEKGQPVKGPFNIPYTWNKIQLNHYVTRSRQDFEEKRKRGGGNIRHSTKLTEQFWNRFQGGKEERALLQLLERIKRK